MSRLYIADARKMSGAEFFRRVFKREQTELDRLRKEAGDKFAAALERAKAERLTETQGDPLLKKRGAA